MSHIRRTASITALFLMSMVGIFAAGPMAFAVDVAPNDGADRPSPAPLASSSGMAGWEIVLIAIAAALVAAAITAAAMRLRFRSNVGVVTA
jgi:hypothetical protein